MNAIRKVANEQIKHFHLIKRLSAYETKSKNRNNYLGSLWEIINPLIQLLIYWFVFQNVMNRSGITISNGETVPYVFWLVAGFILWIFFYKATIEGSSSIYSRIRILSKMNFPMSIIPAFVIFPYLHIHIALLAVAAVIFNVGGYYVNVYYIQFLYLIPATVFLLFGIALITSTLSTMVRDVHMLLNAVLRMFLYVSPVLWEVGKIAEPFGTLLKLNPLYYLIEGYRAAYFGIELHFVAHWEYTLYFWAVALTLFAIGSVIHVKFRRHFVDFV